MKILMINNDGKTNKAYFVNPKKSIPSTLKLDIDKITKEDVFDIVDYMIENEVEMDEYKDGLLPNPAQDTIYKSLYTNLKGIIDSKDTIIAEVDAKFKEAEEKYTK